LESHRKFHHHDEAERRKWQDPEAILGEIGLGPGQVFVDVGCGDGFFSIPAARVVGPSGLVYGMDVDGEAIEDLRRKAASEGLENLRLSVGEAETHVPCQSCADFVFYGIDLHDFYDQARVLANALRMIKPSGILVDLDWKKEPSPMGPPMEIRFTVDHARHLIESAGFVIVAVSEPGPYHYLILARPAGGTQDHPGVREAFKRD